jgi:diaminopimelate epimerase
LIAKGIPFQKMSGSGNDFVVFDGRKGPAYLRSTRFVRAVCRRRTGVGADGVLIMERSRRADFRLRYFNADGTEAAMCGNGGRCLSWFAHSVGAAGREMVLEAGDGLHRARLTSRGVEVEIMAPRIIHRGVNISVRGRRLLVDLVDVGVPHLVVVVEDIETVDVADLGRRLRHHPRFRPRGANVDFLEFRKGGRAVIRTYERGVEAETLACGTGAVAAAAIGVLSGELGLISRILTRGGETLSVRLVPRGTGFSAAFLRGPVRRVFEGTYVWSPQPAATQGSKDQGETGG